MSKCTFLSLFREVPYCFHVLQLIICDKDYVFLGSRLGNSLLLRLNEKGIVKEVIQDLEAVANGDKRAEDIDLTGFDEDDDELIKVKRSRLALDQEEVEVYGSERRSHFIIRTFSFEVSFAN